MKRLLVLTLTLALLLLPGAALANSWGLKGDLLTAVMADHTWDDYTSSYQVGNVAAMTSRYHNAIMLVKDGKSPLEVYTRALWQPTDHKDSAKLTKSGSGFVLSYGKKESYTFMPHEDSFLLTEAVIGDFTLTLTRDDELYIGEESGRTARLYIWGGITLEKFSIRLLPRSIEEILRFNTMRVALDSGSDILGWYEDAMSPGKLYTPGKKGTVPVYGAPSENAWRASSGKAAVSLKGDIWVLREWIGEDGDTWLHIRYEVSQRTHRFGFIKASQLPGYQVVGCETYPQIAVPVRVADLTMAALTDDPLLSQYGQHILLSGTEATAIGMYNDEYALVQTEISGKPAWLFAPLKDLTPVADEVLWDVMAQLEGCWYFRAGGSMAAEYLLFRADGTFCDPSFPENHGVFTVTAYDPAQGKYWNNPPYEITLRYSDGRVNIKGLSLSQEEYDVYDPETDSRIWETHDSFSLTNWEGGGGYIRIDEKDVPDLTGPEGSVG